MLFSVAFGVVTLEKTTSEPVQVSVTMKWIVNGTEGGN